MTRMTFAAALLALSPLVAQAVDSPASTAPAEVAINFTEGVEPAFSGIAVLDAHGAHMETASARTAPGDNKRLAVPVAALPPGVYTVQWHATAVDTHKTEGTYRFTVGG